MRHRVLVFVCGLIAFAGSARAQSNRIDTLTPSAPELAGYGKYAIGVRTLQATDRNRPDVLSTKEGGATAHITAISPSPARQSRRAIVDQSRLGRRATVSAAVPGQ